MGGWVGGCVCVCVCVFVFVCLCVCVLCVCVFCVLCVCADTCLPRIELTDIESQLLSHDSRQHIT